MMRLAGADRAGRHAGPKPRPALNHVGAPELPLDTAIPLSDAECDAIMAVSGQHNLRCNLRSPASPDS